jgi:hypothetical protein
MIIIPKKPRRRRRLPSAERAQPGGLRIASVVNGSAPERLRINFAANVTWNGVGRPLSFQAYTGDEFMDSALDVVETGTDWIEVDFNAEVTLGAAWQLIAPLDGIAPAVAWPQNGDVG